MNRMIKVPGSVLLVVLVFGLLAPLSAAAAQSPVDYKHESEGEFGKQVAAKQVRAVTINRFLRTVQVTLVDGEHLLAKYKKHQEPAVAARLKASGATVTVLSKAEGEKAPREKKPAHHKTRYIIGGAVIVVIVIVGAVLLVLYRRRRD